jgi:DNA-binding NarL/FixJ family response regulator
MIYSRHLDNRNVNVSTAEKHLTKREIEIIRHIADGLTNNEIAAKLFLINVTVETHRKNMLCKTSVKKHGFARKICSGS